MDKRKLVLVFWLFGMLLPFEWFKKVVPLVKGGIGLLVTSEIGHVIGHLILFGGLAVLGLHIFRLPQTWRTALFLVLGVLAVGLGQELLQLQFKGRGFDWPEIFDLGVDLVGAWLGWRMYPRLLRYGRRLRIAYFILRAA